MSSPNPKNAIFAQFAEVAKALGHAHRLVILELLAQRERSVEAVAESAKLSIANASQHLRLMRRAGLLASRRDGKQILYRLSDPGVLDLVAALHRVGERNVAEIREIVGGYFHERDALEPVSREEMARRLEDGLVTVLDVRPEDEFAAGHLPQAVNVPLRELARRLREFPKNREVVAYCRGPYCVFAFEAVALLREHGFKVRRLEDGYPEWKAAGLPIA
ncbi:metalloregulator ArsR/SmtB family transcription factor [Rhodoblastus sp. 17X3]|uniref:ArsR/SmtB family transcription factor n=1 Tax=Rhodoblastus sp. 17X3 TaxID=3047026 RepID=UPI0024B68F70|nr:metalloregulator ArsR/SmtB family transcription factor [Rhodoblastus sp. 17X3]MDI9847080.1 metalloregulator ArsR/SmtB family transcription factor [Rhodoblastus sp. 17X3]